MKLNQVVSIEKEVKNKAHGEISAMHHESMKHDGYFGFSKVYKKSNEEGEDFPPEKKLVQLKSEEVFGKVHAVLKDLFNITAAKDYANCNAIADVTLEDGEILLTKVPATYLIFLEKQLTDLRTFVSKMPTLDTSEEWAWDGNLRIYKTEPTLTNRSKKVQKPIVLYPATPEHPAQTQLVTEDVNVGNWETVKQSGALSVPRKEEVLSKIEKLLHAVKMAREEANGVDAPKQDVASRIFTYIFS